MRALIASLVLIPTSAMADPLQDVRPDFMMQCASDGNDTATCTCMFDSWAETVPNDQKKIAATAIMMFAGVQPSSQAEMMAAASMAQSMGAITMQCALGISSEDLYAGGDAMGLANGVMAGGLGALIEAAPADSDPNSTVAVLDVPAKEIPGNLASTYEAELAKIHGHPIEGRALADFQPVFTSYCHLRGGTNAKCGCSWGVLVSSGASSDTAYLASRSEGDDVLEHLPRNRLNAALDGLDRYHRARAACPD